MKKGQVSVNSFIIWSWTYHLTFVISVFFIKAAEFPASVRAKWDKSVLQVLYKYLSSNSCMLGTKDHFNS